ncbi:MAG: SCP2 sterol-binding domain-containing protein [Marmoricola sp.]
MPGLADRLGGLSAAGLTTFFTDTGAVEITEMIQDASDAELTKLVADDRVRAEAVLAILRFPEFADPGRLATIDGVVCFDLVREGSANECHTVRFSGGSVGIVPEETAKDVTIGAGILDFVRLVTGERNPALLYLSDELRIDGDEMLALAVGTVFRVPGTKVAAVDPSTLDPVDVATAVAQTSHRHLREVMSSGFRAIVLDEVFKRFPEFLVPEKARDLDLVVGFRIGGRPDSEPDRYVVHVDRGECRVDASAGEGSRRDATISIDGVDFLKLITGQLNPVKGVLTGALKVKGDRAKALGLNAVMNPPKPRARTRH